MTRKSANKPNQTQPSWLELYNTPTAPCRGVSPTTTSILIYGIKAFDGEAPVMLEFGEMQSIPSLPSFLNT